MASPYRTRPPTPPRVRSIDQRRRLSVASLVFGMLCGVTGISLADEGRAECALLFTGVCGFVLLLQR
ncbi:hypothetical protein predicted by Glimmer/Critica [Sorangium cellulosum So ce56]|uniref:Uncharacterized protein n=1 Tax=Sorangium cellulosum (strain So ce56) TaxID=448385 RepID=A9F125_SORC5|nr:hypothetical protein [Sorangium cellulosum]CAN91325.1 hypothetical protein predicted by Glimmer/Critica [Sorangium cellulosum So ce56]